MIRSGLGPTTNAVVHLLQRKQALPDGLAELLDTIPDALVALDREWRCTYMNLAAKRMLGALAIPLDDVLNNNIWDRIPGTAGTRFLSEFHRAFETQTAIEFEERFEPLDRWYQVRVFPSESGVLGYTRDITDQKRSEERLAERSCLLELSAEVGSVLTRNNTLADVLQGAAEAMVRHLDAAFARIWTLSIDENVLELRASAGLYTHLDGPHSRVPVGALKIGRIASERTPHLTNSVIGDPQVGDQEWAHREKMVAFAGYPLVVGDRLVGVIALFSRRLLSDTTLSAMEAVADQVAVGIERLHAQEQLVRSNELQEITLRSIGDAVITTDAEARVTFLNDAAQRLTAWSYEDAFGRPIVEVFHIVHADTRLEVESPILRALRENQVVGLANHTILIARDGREISIDDSGAPIRDAEGQVRGAVLVFRDVSQHQSAERELRKSEERLRMALAAANMGTWEWSITTNEIEWSDNLESIHGTRPGSFDGTFEGYLQVIHPDDRAIFTASVQQAIGTGQPFYAEFRLVWDDGSCHWMSGEGRVFYNEEGAPVRMIGVGRDVTERRIAQEQLQESREQVAALNARLHRAVFESSHRIKNHLQVLGAMVDLQLMNNAEVVPVEEWVRLGRQIRTLAVIHDHLTLETRNDAEATEVSAHTVLDTVLSMLRETAVGRQIEYDLAELKLPVKSITSLVLVVNELVTNSIKHGTAHTHVRLSVVKGNIELCVEDDGPGFPDGFDPVTHANTGLDLIETMAKTDLQGRVVYANRTSGGASVTVLFPNSV